MTALPALMLLAEAPPIETVAASGSAWIAWTVALLFVPFGLACLTLALLGLPGVWILIGGAVVVNLADGWWLPEAERPTFSIGVLVAATLLAAIGEAVEFLASAVGAKRGGASRSGIAGALVGALVGSIAGTLLIPIPVVGTLLGAVGGSFLGALLGELHRGATPSESIRPASAAAIGRTLGTLGKLPIAVAVWAVLTVAVFW